METARKPTKISRVDLRYRHFAQDVSPNKKSVRERKPGSAEKEAEVLDKNGGELLLIREQKGRPVMGSAHQMFHRRQAASKNILTVNIEVVATVDGDGNIIAQETVTPVLPSVPAVPTDPLPSVPSVPAFPSDLLPPSYPWPSGVPSASLSSQLVISSPVPTSAPASTPGVTPPVPSQALPSLGFNSTISNSITIPSSSFFSLTNSTSSTSSTSSSSSSSLLSSSSSSRSSSSSTQSSSASSSASTSSSAASTTQLGGPGGGQEPAVTAPPPSASTAASGAVSASNDDGTPATPTVVGSVVGSLAGAAILAFIVLFLLRRHKQKRRGRLQLTGNDTTDNQPIASSGQQMATRSSFVPAGAAAFFGRFSGASKETAASSTTGERGFQRISGRKLPSAFSEGMTSEQFARGEGTLSGSSFYKDDQGFYGGPGVAAGKDFGKETGEASGSGTMGTRERILPSPARTPVVVHPDDAPPWGTSRNGGSTLSPPVSPNPDFPPRSTLGRSHPSHDGSRSSRFTENV